MDTTRAVITGLAVIVPLAAAYFLWTASPEPAKQSGSRVRARPQTTKDSAATSGDTNEMADGAC